MGRNDTQTVALGGWLASGVSEAENGKEKKQGTGTLAREEETMQCEHTHSQRAKNQKKKTVNGLIG